MFEVKKCVLRGFAAQCKCQVLSILRSPLLLILLPFALGFGVGFTCAMLKNSLLLPALLTVIAVCFTPYFSIKTLSSERRQGMHFSPREHGYRRGVLILGTFTVNVLTWLIIAFLAVISHAFFDVKVLGVDFDWLLLLKLLLFSCVFCAYVCAVELLVSCYSSYRLMPVIFGVAAALLLVGACYVAGLPFESLLIWFVAPILIGFCVALLALSYFSYKLRAYIYR